MGILSKNKDGYGYKYTDLSEIHRYLEENGMMYYQEIETTEGNDYILTYRYIDGKWEEKPKRGCRITQATLSDKSNPAQEQGSALTYARRYSLLMAFGLSTEDDDGEALTRKEEPKLINATMVASLRDLIKSLGVTDEEVLTALHDLKVNKLAELKYDQVEEFRKKLGQ
jgi:hypothetical protein